MFLTRADRQTERPCVCVRLCKMSANVCGCAMFVQIDMAIAVSANYLVFSLCLSLDRSVEMLRAANLAHTLDVCCIHPSIYTCMLHADDVYRFLPLFVCHAHHLLPAFDENCFCRAYRQTFLLHALLHWDIESTYAFPTCFRCVSFISWCSLSSPPPPNPPIIRAFSLSFSMSLPLTLPTSPRTPTQCPLSISHIKACRVIVICVLSGFHCRSDNGCTTRLHSHKIVCDHNVCGFKSEI